MANDPGRGCFWTVLIWLDGLGSTLSRHVLLALNLSVGLFIGPAVAAPWLMALGLAGPAQIVYALYGLTCHQLPQRSYFLFGPRLIQTYSWDELLAHGMDPGWPAGFAGGPATGYKMAMAHRNTAIYAALFAGGILYGLSRRRLGPRLRPLPLIRYLWLAIPLFLDGSSHVVSEVTGLGFRQANGWLVALTGSALGPAFYSGDGLGSFNWLVRTLTGALFGLATIWAVYPRLESTSPQEAEPTPLQGLGGHWPPPSLSGR